MEEKLASGPSKLESIMVGRYGFFFSFLQIDTIDFFLLTFSCR